MEQVSSMQQGIDFMLSGMVIVSTFLVVLIGATLAMSALVKLVAGEPVVRHYKLAKVFQIRANLHKIS
tara:strand:- start:520 stop:723 length:204 start_codon:yes stop_codon:yes gene_type:complete